MTSDIIGTSHIIVEKDDTVSLCGVTIEDPGPVTERRVCQECMDIVLNDPR